MALSEKDLISYEEVITELLEQGNAGQAVAELLKLLESSTTRIFKALEALQGLLVFLPQRVFAEDLLKLPRLSAYPL